MTGTSRLLLCATIVGTIGCGALTSKAQFRAYESAALERDPERQVALAARYRHDYPGGLYGDRVDQIARGAEPAVQQIRSEREAAVRVEQAAAEAARRAEEQRHQAEAEAARLQQERLAAAQLDARGVSLLPGIEAEVRARVAADNWDSALSSVNGWLREFGGTPSAPRGQALVVSIERARAFDSVIRARGAKRLDRPVRRYIKEGGTVARGVPEDAAHAPAGIAPFAFGASVDIWFTAGGGWSLVAPPDAQATGGSLMALAGWVRDGEITTRDVGAEEQRRVAAEAEREARRQEAEAIREAARQAREQAARARQRAALQEGSYVCFRDCMNQLCPRLAACWDSCGWDVACARACTGAAAPCTNECHARCDVR